MALFRNRLSVCRAVPLCAAALVSALFFLTALCACSRAGSADGAVAMEEAVEMGAVSMTAGAAPRMALSAKAAAPAAMEFADADAAGSAGGASSSASGTGTVKKLIRNASVSVEVRSLEEASASVEKLAADLGGYVSNSETSRNSARMTLRVPAQKFDEAVSGAEAAGRLLSRTVSVDDVSEEYYDLDTRLQTRKILHEKLSGYLRQATRVEDLLSIERQLNNVQTEIESMEGRFRRLNDLIDMSTISVRMSLPSYSEPEKRGFVFPDLTGKFRDTVSSILGFFSSLAMTLVLVIVCGVPLVLAVALLYWLSFGKVGLVRKLFSKVRK